MYIHSNVLVMESAKIKKVNTKINLQNKTHPLLPYGCKNVGKNKRKNVKNIVCEMINRD